MNTDKWIVLEKHWIFVCLSLWGKDCVCMCVVCVCVSVWEREGEGSQSMEHGKGWIMGKPFSFKRLFTWRRYGVKKTFSWGRVVSSQFYHRTITWNNLAHHPEISSHFQKMNYIIASFVLYVFQMQIQYIKMVSDGRWNVIK